MFCQAATFTVVVVVSSTYADTASANGRHELIVTNPFYGDQSNLPFYNVTNVCTRGVWGSYADENYQDTIQFHSKLDYFCENTGDSAMRSARFVGLEENYAAPSVTLFDDIYLAGEPITFSDEVLNIEISVSSFVSINATVELFEQPNFGGKSICNEQEQIACDIGACWTWRLYPENFPWDITTAKSARTFCSCMYRSRQTFHEKGPCFAPKR